MIIKSGSYGFLDNGVVARVSCQTKATLPRMGEPDLTVRDFGVKSPTIRLPSRSIARLVAYSAENGQ